MCLSMTADRQTINNMSPYLQSRGHYLWIVEVNVIWIVILDYKEERAIFKHTVYFSLELCSY